MDDLSINKILDTMPHRYHVAVLPDQTTFMLDQQEANLIRIDAEGRRTLRS